jgi:hypothetical protein
VFLAEAIPHAALLERCDVISGADFSPIASTATLYVMSKLLFFSIDVNTMLRRYSRYCGIAAVASAAPAAPAAVASAHATADSIRSLVLFLLSFSLLITVTWPHSSSIPYHSQPGSYAMSHTLLRPTRAPARRQRPGGVYGRLRALRDADGAARARQPGPRRRAPRRRAPRRHGARQKKIYIRVVFV